MIITEEGYLAHIGVLRKSGRYPWGSGDDDKSISELNKTFLGTVASLKKQGFSESEIAKGMGMTSKQLRSHKSIAKNALTQDDINMAQRLRDKGMGQSEIARRMSTADRKIGESTVRAWLAPGRLDKLKILDVTTDALKRAVEEKKYVDIGLGVEQHLGISNDKLKKAVDKLRMEGYTEHWVKVDQLSNAHQTTFHVLAAPDTPWKEVFDNQDKISPPLEYSTDGGRSTSKIQPPIQVSSKRIAVRYAEEGGKDADGVIYVRPGVSDLTLGSAHYAQVRIAVDGTHYLKGMAMFKDDLPDGVDLMFNTNKSDTGNKLDAMKPLKDDPNTGGFGSIVRQLNKQDENGRDIPNTLRSAMNIVNEEGNWDEWTPSLSSQFLSKQSPTLAKEQLGRAYDKKKQAIEEASRVTNPAVKKMLLNSAADDADSSAIHLKAAALPRQRTQVILPITSMKPNEVYAPNFNDGELVVLVRHPHGGKFEIPELRVNNRQPEAKKQLGSAVDAIGIHPSVASKLSGADFDGDTVLVIPNDQRKVQTAPSLERLKDFDPQSAYPGFEGMPDMTDKQKGSEMGKISNLIMDMDIRGATDDELARAVRHSMVVIDAQKHKLNYKASARDHGITSLKVKYQDGATAGANTLISKSGTNSKITVPKRKQGYQIDKETGKKIYTETGSSYVLKKDKISKTTGKVIKKAGTLVEETEKVSRLSVVEDAHTESSGTKIEEVYADHSNALKALADSARKEMVNTPTIPYNPSAAKHYAKEVTRLSAALNMAIMNSPLERRALILANAAIAKKTAGSPDMDAGELKKLKFIELENARLRTGAQKHAIEISDSEWSAIQAGAITNNKLVQILNYADLDKIKERALPRVQEKMSPALKSRAIEMMGSGNYSQAAIAQQLGVSLSTLKRSLKPDGEADDE